MVVPESDTVGNDLTKSRVVVPEAAADGLGVDVVTLAELAVRVVTGVEIELRRKLCL